MATFSKTTDVSVIALRIVTAGEVYHSSAQSVATKMAAALWVRVGRTVATALTNPVQIRIEATPEASGDGHWAPVAVLDTDILACESEAATGTNNAAQAVITVASTTNLAARDVVFIKNTTLGNSEFGRIESVVTNTSITLEEVLANAQSTGAATIYDRAEIFQPVLVDLAAYTRLRVVVDNSGTAQQDVAVDCFMATLDAAS